MRKSSADISKRILLSIVRAVLGDLHGGAPVPVRLQVGGQAPRGPPEVPVGVTMVDKVIFTY